MKQKPGHSSSKKSNPVPMKKFAPLTYNGTPNKPPLRMSDYGTSPVKKKLGSPIKQSWAPSGMAQQAAAGQAQNMGSRLGAGTGTTGSNLFAPVGQTVQGGGGAPGGGGGFGANTPAQGGAFGAAGGGAGSGGVNDFIDEKMLEASGVADEALKGAGVDTSDVQGTGKVGDMEDNRVTDYVKGDKKGNRKKKRAARKAARKEFKEYRKNLTKKKREGKKALKEQKRAGLLSGKEYRQAKRKLRKDTRKAKRAARKAKRRNRRANRKSMRKNRR